MQSLAVIDTEWNDVTISSPTLALVAKGVEDGTAEGLEHGPRPYGHWRCVAFFNQPSLSKYEAKQYLNAFLFGVLQGIQLRREVRGE